MAVRRSDSVDSVQSQASETADETESERLRLVRITCGALGARENNTPLRDNGAGGRWAAQGCHPAVLAASTCDCFHQPGSPGAT
eukprot:COSAG05_NODE_1121_length_5808_cov_2.774391_8_plen_84_part_00